MYLMFRRLKLILCWSRLNLGRKRTTQYDKHPDCLKVTTPSASAHSHRKLGLTWLDHNIYTLVSY